MDNATARGEFVVIAGANLLTMYDTIQYLREKGIMGYQHIGYDRQSTEMDALRNYLISRLLWDEDMTREEYLATMDEFLQVYYGAGASYVRQYIDKIGDTTGMDHKTYTKYIGLLGRTQKKDATFVMECLDIWKKAIEAADTDRHVYNIERSSLHLYQMCIDVGLRDKELANTLKAFCEKYGLVSEVG